MGELKNRSFPTRGNESVRGRVANPARYDVYMPLKLTPATMMEVVVGHPDFMFQSSAQKGPRNPRFEFCYRYHNDYGHKTNRCRHLKDAIEKLIQDGHFLDFVKGRN